MIFFYVGIVLGMVLLTYGTKKGWLAGKIDAFEAQPKEKEIPTFKEMIEEDREGMDTSKDVFERFKERAEGDVDFKNKAMDLAKERKERMFKGMSAQEREMLENYLKESIEAAKKEEAENQGYEAFRSYTCEIFVLCSLILFIWWGISRHYSLISPTLIAETLFKYFSEFFGLNKGAKHDL